MKSLFTYLSVFCWFFLSLSIHVQAGIQTQDSIGIETTVESDQDKKKAQEKAAKEAKKETSSVSLVTEMLRDAWGYFYSPEPAEKPKPSTATKK